MKIHIQTFVAALGLMICTHSVLAQTGQLAPGVDLNADGKAELLSASAAANQVKVLDGATHATFITINGPVANSGFGAGIAWLSDVNGDGLSDLAVIAPGTAHGTGSSASTGTVYLYSLATGALIASNDAPAGRALGGVVKVVSDQDSDSVADVVVDLQWTGSQTKSILISGKTGQVLVELPGTAAEMALYVAQGGRLYARADFDGSGTVDLLDVAGFTTLVTNGDMRADLNHDGVIDGADSLMMMDEAGEGIVTIAAQSWSPPAGGSQPECQCTITPSGDTNGNSNACSGVSFDVSYPTWVEVGEPIQMNFTGHPAGGAFCAEIVQGDGRILGESRNPLTVVAHTPSGLCVRVKYTVDVGGTVCTTCQTVCLAAELFCPGYSISLRSPTLADSCPVTVSANAINTIFALVSPEGSAVHWEIQDPNHVVEWTHEYPTQLRFRAKNVPGSFTVYGRYGPENGPCSAAYASCVVNIDPDSDGDGLSDSWENAHCTSPTDHDTDHDGVWDGVELAMGTDPCNASSTPAMIDSDQDGLTDIEELQVYHTDPHNFDTDGDGISDYAEVELARLGVLALDPLNAYSLADANTSLSRVFDGWQPVYYTAWDKDRDGLFDPWELATGLDPTQADQDQDGIADGLEMRPRVTGADNSGHPSYAPARSPMFAEDGVRGGDISVDSDGDGLTDIQELWLGTDSYSWDTDHDGIFDAEEAKSLLNPVASRSDGLAFDGTGDFDGDGLLNNMEFAVGGDLGNADTDGDGTNDETENTQGSFVDDASDNGQVVSSPDWLAFTVTCTDDWGPEYFGGGPSILRIGNQVLRGTGVRAFRVPIGTSIQATLEPSVVHRVHHSGLLIPAYAQYVTSSVSGLGVLISSEYRTIHYDGEYESQACTLGDGVDWNFDGQMPSWTRDEHAPFHAVSRLYAPRIVVRDAKGWGFSFNSCTDGEFTQDLTQDHPSDAVDGAYADGASLLLIRLEPWPKNLWMNLKLVFENYNHVPFPIDNNTPGHVVSIKNPPGLEFGTEIIKYQIKHSDVQLSSLDEGIRQCLAETAEPQFACGCASYIRGPGCFLYVPPDHFPLPSSSESPQFAPESSDPLGSADSSVHFKICVLQIPSGHESQRWVPLPGSTRILLRKAPLVLVHGFTDNPVECWSHPQWASLDRPHRNGRASDITKADYGATSYLGLDSNMPALVRAIQCAMENARGRDLDGISLAATRVDIVAHSMGGLITRWYMADTSRWFLHMGTAKPARGNGWPDFNIYRSSNPSDDRRRNSRDDNFGLGDINRFVSIATPFNGAPLGDYCEPIFRPDRGSNPLVVGTAVVVREAVSAIRQVPTEARMTFFTADHSNPFANKWIYTGPTGMADMVGKVEWPNGRHPPDRPWIVCPARNFVELTQGGYWLFHSFDNAPYAGAPFCAWHPIGTIVRNANLRQLINDPERYAASKGLQFLTYNACLDRWNTIPNYLQIFSTDTSDLVVPFTSAMNSDEWWGIDNTWTAGDQTCSKVLGHSGSVDNPLLDVAHSFFYPYLGQPDSPLVFEEVVRVLGSPREQYRGIGDLYK